MKNKINKEKINIFFKNIYENSNSTKKKKNLNIVYNVLLNLYESASSNFSIAHIGKLSKKEGGPIAQTIRNAQGKDYKDLINYFVDNITILSNYQKDTEFDISDYIDDPAIKAHINILIAENKSLKNQLNIIKNNMSNNYELNYIQNNEQSYNIRKLLLKTEIDSIKKFLNDLENLRLSIYLSNNGTIRSEDDELIANIGFVDGLKKLLKV